jgi:hypothetical protein
MATTPRHIRTPLIALAAIFAAALAAGEASACSVMKQGDAACSTVCGCCSPRANEAPATSTEVARRANTPQAPRACQSAPRGDCSCRSQEPAAPARKPARSTAQGRAELGQSSAFVPLGEIFAARITPSPQVSANQSPPKTPLYLRNERLLF